MTDERDGSTVLIVLALGATALIGVLLVTICYWLASA